MKVVISTVHVLTSLIHGAIASTSGSLESFVEDESRASDAAPAGLHRRAFRPHDAFDRSPAAPPMTVAPNPLPSPAQARAIAELNERSREIFRQIVESYLATGEPVGSRNISRILPMTLSPASVRNVMADLEHAGLIYAPHTSAGRLPTEIGLRFFVDAMLEIGDVCRRGARAHRGADARRRHRPHARDARSPRPRRCSPACRAAPASSSPRSRIRG